MDSISIIATNLLADLAAMPKASLFIEARLHVTYALNEEAHDATIALYTRAAIHPERNTIFRGDEADDYLNVAISTSTASNKRFIEALTKELEPSWRYHSYQCQLGFDQPGAKDVSARFSYQQVLDALLCLQSKNRTEVPTLLRSTVVTALTGTHLLNLLKPVAARPLLVKFPQQLRHLLVLARGGGQLGICYAGFLEVRFAASATTTAIGKYLFSIAQRPPHKVEYHKFMAEFGELVAAAPVGAA